jgi:hypothetical protein
MPRHSRTVVTGFLACAALLIASRASSEQEAPRSYTASPDVYKVIAQNDKTKVILATWKPGQRDQVHSHPRWGIYFLTDCDTRNYLPDGKIRDGSPKAGTAAVGLGGSHSVENRGTTECRMVIVEQEE